MTIVGINSHPGGSTKNIMCEVLDIAHEKSGCNTYSFWGTWKKTSAKSAKGEPFGFLFENYLSALLSRTFGLHGCFSFLGTYLLLRRIKKISPDIIHLHTLHLWTVNIPLLIKYIKRNHVKVIWTMHDCWAFTGHCAHFTYENCFKWKDGTCSKCPRIKDYPTSYIDNSHLMWNLKKWFTSIDEMTIVTPSCWLKELVSQSFLNSYPIVVINNGIDLDIFRPTISDFRARFSIPNTKFIILGVAFQWGDKKGLDVFLELYRVLNKNLFQIVLVGINDEIRSLLPKEICSITRTGSRTELAEIYTAADLFVNPTREENYPTVNMESLACGTPVLTFNTGGCAEIIKEKCGMVVENNDFNELCDKINYIYNEKPFRSEDCVEYAKCFDFRLRYQQYISLYNDIGFVSAKQI